MKNKETFNLTNPQRSILLTEQFYSGSSINNIGGSFFINEKVNFDLFKRAINLVIEHNDSFNIRLSLENNEIKQFITDFEAIDFDIIDVNSKEEVFAIENDFMQEVFDIFSRLFKFKLFRLPNGFGGFIINIHHLISDSWSLGLICREIANVYVSLVKNEEPNLDVLHPYLDYIYAEHDYLNSNKFEKDKQYWNNIFDSIPNSCSIPSKKKTDNDFSCKAFRSIHTVSKQDMNKINEFCKNNKISVFNFFMAIFAIYTSRVSGLEDFVIGTPILNRTDFKEKNTLGMFINVIPCRFNLNSNLSFKSFVSIVAKDSLSMLRHQKYSNQFILEELRKRNPSLPSLYNSIMSYQITKKDTTNGIDYDMHWGFNGNSGDDFDIHIYDLNDTGCVNLTYDYRVNKYDEDDITNIHKRILHMIHQVLDNANIGIYDIDIVTKEEKEEILYKFNNTKMDYPKDKTIVDLFEEQARKTPNAVAVVFEDEQLTYKGLNEKANQLAHCLVDNGVNNNDIISVCMNKNISFIITVLGILKCGCAYLPINPTYPFNRINYIVKDSNSKLFITDTNYNLENSTTLVYDNINFKKYEKNKLLINIDTSDLAYIIYTSGSTGNPKGVMVTHNNLVNFLFSFNNCFNNKFGSKDNCLSLTNISFDVSVCEIFTPLAFGCTLVLYPEDTLTSIPLLCDILTKNKITFLYIPPSVLNDVSKFIISNKIKVFIDKLLVGVEAIKNSTLNKFLEINKNMEIVNGYGPTEATICTTFYKYKFSNNLNENVPIGSPISNSKIFILDKNNNILPIGVVGELCISGDNVSKGYLNNIELTNQTFIHNSRFSSKSVYKTGDLAYWTPNGTLSFIGRNDAQIKFKGHRIELNEINTALVNINTITNSYTMIKKVNNIDSICSYITTNENIKIEDVYEHLYNNLPYYMIPSHIMVLDAFPLTLNGKIDKNKLPEIIVSTSINNNDINYNETELLLIKTICKLLNIEHITALDNLFDFGLDSLIAIKLSTEIFNIFNVNILIKDIFNNASIKKLAKLINSLSNTNKTIIPKTSKQNYYPVSSAQRRIYYASSLDNNSLLYNIAGGIIVDATLDVKKLEQCFNTIIDRHESLRTYFDVIDDNIVQKILDKLDFKLDFETSNSSNVDALFDAFVKPFNLNKAPLFNAKLINLPNNKSFLLLNMHHIISDGTSLSLLMNELCTLYNGSSDLPTLDINYKDFAVWENNKLMSNEFDKDKEFWVSQFNDEIPLLNMPTNYNRPTIQSFEGDNVFACINKDLTFKLNELSKQLGITPYMLLLSVYYVLLYKYTGQDDIVVGSPIVGRDNSQLANIIGMFVNSLALRNKINSSLSFKDFVSEIKTNCLNAFEHQTYPFDELVKQLNIKRDTSRNPLFDTMFIYQNNGNATANFKGINSTVYVPNANIAKFDLSLEIIPENDELNLRFEYCTKLFDKDFITRLSNHYLNILQAILADNAITIANIDILSSEERKQILYDFNNTKADYPKDKTVIQLFEEQARKTPNAVAVVFEDEQLTYRELNEKANQLARLLLAHNAKNNDKICLILDKSLEMIVSILGVLKIGATFVPVDINYPKERIDYIINDTNAKILLTTQNLINKATDTAIVLNVELNNFFYSQYKNDNLNICYNPDTLAYIMFTSGSTGNPKGVMVTHKNIIRLVKNNNFINYQKNEHILQTGSIVFDACTFEIWGALLNGYELFIIEKELLLDTTYLKNYIQNNKITSLFITTQLFNQLIDLDIDIFSTISNVLTGGEAVSINHMNKLNLYNKNINIIHCYGPTENTTFSTCYNVKKIEYNNTIPIGKPIANSTAYIVNTSGILCPIGVPGELWVGGDGVAKGYLNNESLTNEKFIDNPFGSGKIYKTGDLVKWLADGNIEFIGRIDNQVKVRGFRIELSEIDSKILTYPGIKYAITTLNTINNEKVICSYYVANNIINVTELKDFLKRFLPTYMIPTYMLQMEKFEMNINGKIDKKSLPCDFKILKQTRTIELPINKYEHTLLKIFNKVLKINDISITDNLFDDLGGDSLIAMKIQVESLSQNINIAYSDIFKYPTIRSLSNHLINKSSTNDFMTEICNIDYENYNKVLLHNSLKEPIEIKNMSIKNLMLTGFTGFLGAHILDSFLKKETGTIYCLIRSKNNISAYDRLLNILHFYFDNKYDNLLGNRIKLIEGDISLDNFGLSEKNYNKLGNIIDTIIHSAALVKHYGIYEDFEKSNVIGTKNIVDFASKFKINLLHISTLSVSGNNFADGSNIDNHFGKNVNFCETDFYIGQNLASVYAKTKFIAEKIVLDAIYNNSLKACILRMGNLTSRFSEGKFQQNHFENAFVNRFKSFLQIGYIPDYMLSLYAEFTPIDYCGDAIIEIARHFNEKYTVLHLMNEKRLYLDKLFEMMSTLNINIKVVPEDKFVRYN